MLIFPLQSASAASPCGTDTSYVRLWENGSSDHGDGDDSLYLCASHSNLNSISHLLPGDCENGFPPPGKSTWNDCISSWSVWLPNGNYVACIYNYQDYYDFGNTHKYIHAVVGPAVGRGGIFRAVPRTTPRRPFGS